MNQPPFASLPESTSPIYRWAGTNLVDEEEYRICEYHLYRETEWRPTIEGIHAYARLREQRKEERKSAWQARVERDEEYSDSIQDLIEKSAS